MNETWLLVVLVLVGMLLFAVAWVLLTHRRPYECPPDRIVVATVKRHADALPIFACLLAAGIDANVVEETGKSFARRVTYRFFLPRAGEVTGPWYVVVPRDAQRQARGCLKSSAESLDQS